MNYLEVQNIYFKTILFYFIVSDSSLFDIYDNFTTFYMFYFTVSDRLLCDIYDNFTTFHIFVKVGCHRMLKQAQKQVQKIKKMDVVCY